MVGRLGLGSVAQTSVAQMACRQDTWRLLDNWQLQIGQLAYSKSQTSFVEVVSSYIKHYQRLQLCVHRISRSKIHIKARKRVL